VPRREIVNAILHVLNRGIRWRAMPPYVPDLPHGSTPTSTRGRRRGWEKAVQALAQWDGEREGRDASSSALVMDSQFVKTMGTRRSSRGGNARSRWRRGPSLKGLCPVWGDGPRRLAEGMEGLRGLELGF